MNSIAVRAYVSLLLSCLSFGQAGAPKPPCAFSGELLRDAQGNVVSFASDEMKRRATHKVDVGPFMKQIDIKGTAVLDVLVGPFGEVICVKTLTGHPILQAEVEKALHAWTFEPAKARDQPVAYLGRLEFTLCNISCGKEGIHMSILK
jgi:Gram-negative bacterial TonB protein C-terminal